MRSEPVGQLLVERGLVSSEVIEEALRDAKTEGGRLCSRLLEMGACEEGELVAVLADKHDVPGVDLSRTVISLDMLDLVPAKVAEVDGILPLSTEGDRLHVAVASPSEGGRALAEIRFVTGREVSPYVAVDSALKGAIRSAYACRARGEKTWRGKRAEPGAPPKIAAVLPPGEPIHLGEEDLESVGELSEPAGGEAEIEIDLSSGAVEPLGGPRRVLVVDDEPEIRLLVQRTLEKNGYAVTTAADGAEALARVEAAPPDLVLLDAMLPKLHGFEVCRRIRANPRTRDVPVVIMTAVYRGWRFAQDARESFGAQDYIEKPFHLAELLRCVAGALQSDPGPAQGASSAEPHLKRGRDLISAGRLEEGLAAFEKAVEIDPFCSEAHHLLARALRARGEHFRAMTSFERAVELRPNLFAALRSLAALYLETGFRRKAAETTERALQVAPDDAMRESMKKELLKLL